MQPLMIAICDDEKSEQLELESKIKALSPDSRIKAFDSGDALLSGFIPGFYDLIFMDIYMENTDGICATEKIRELDAEVTIIFTTTSKDHALEAYRFHVLRYLEKPVRTDEQKDALLISEKIKKETPGITVKTKEGEVKVSYGQVCYIEQSLKVLKYRLSDGKTLECSGRLDELESALPHPPFFRAHKSYLVNLSYVSSIDRILMVFKMKDGGNVHIRRENLSAASRAFTSYIFAETRKG